MLWLLAALESALTCQGYIDGKNWNSVVIVTWWAHELDAALIGGAQRQAQCVPDVLCWWEGVVGASLKSNNWGRNRSHDLEAFINRSRAGISGWQLLAGCRETGRPAGSSGKSGSIRNRRWAPETIYAANCGSHGWKARGQPRGSEGFPRSSGNRAAMRSFSIPARALRGAGLEKGEPACVRAAGRTPLRRCLSHASAAEKKGASSHRHAAVSQVWGEWWEGDGVFCHFCKVPLSASTSGSHSPAFPAPRCRTPFI